MRKEKRKPNSEPEWGILLEPGQRGKWRQDAGLE